MCLYRYNTRTQHTQTAYLLTICAIHGTIRIQYDIQYICVAHMCKSHMRQYHMCVIDACYNILIQSMYVAFYACTLFVQYKYAPYVVRTCVLHKIHMAIDTCISVHSTHVCTMCLQCMYTIHAYMIVHTRLYTVNIPHSYYVIVCDMLLCMQHVHNVCV